MTSTKNQVFDHLPLSTWAGPPSIPIVDVHAQSTSSLATTHCSDTTQGSHIDLPLAYWSSSQVFDLIRLPSSAISLRPLRSLDRHDLYVPRARTSMAQTRAFAIIGPSLWNQLLPSTRSTLLTGVPSASFRSLKTAFFSLGLAHWKRF